MSNIAGAQPLPRQPPALRADTLADSIVILLVLTVVQRAVGFCRAVLFCRWLDPGQLGEWEMAFGFFLLAGPLVVLALPGAFGRYVEHFRQKGQLRTFLRRTMLVCAAMASAATLAIVVFRGWFARLIFGDSDLGSLAALVAASLLAVVAFNFLTELFTALRNVRLVAGLQFINSVAFAVLGIGMILGWGNSASTVVAAYGGACLVSVLIAGVWLGRTWRNMPDGGTPLAHRVLWRKLVPFAFWIWCGNVLGNLFELVDRYLIVHAMPVDHDTALALVGQYHSSRVMPALLFSIATLLGAMITPHLSCDWEAGRRDQVSARLNLFLKMLAAAMVAAGVLVLCVAPLLFGVAFQGKFAQGEAILPWTLIYSIWFGLAAVAQNYLWCAEKARWGSLALLVGLTVNVLLNLMLLPRLGLLGAVLATSGANALVLALVCTFDRIAGFQIDRSTWVLLALPLVLCLGPGTAAGVLAIVVLDGLVFDRLLTREEKRLLTDTVTQYAARLRNWSAGWHWPERSTA